MQRKATSGIMLTLLMVSLFVLVSNIAEVKSQGTILGADPFYDPFDVWNYTGAWKYYNLNAAEGYVSVSDGMLHVSGYWDGMNYQDGGLKTISGFDYPITVETVLRSSSDYWSPAIRFGLFAPSGGFIAISYDINVGGWHVGYIDTTGEYDVSWWGALIAGSWCTLKLVVTETNFKVYQDNILMVDRDWSPPAEYPKTISLTSSYGESGSGDFDWVNINAQEVLYIHDVAVIGFVYDPPFKTVVGQNYTTFVMVKVQNQGNFTETFNVSAYYVVGTTISAISIELWPDGVNTQTFWSMGDVNKDGYIEIWDLILIARLFGSVPGSPHWDPDADINSDGKIDMKDNYRCAGNIGKDIWTTLGIPKLIENQKPVTLASGNSTTVIFRWNTTGVAKGNYGIAAHAWPVPGETDTTDNTLGDSGITVAMIGDIVGLTGPPDGKVYINDVATVAVGFGAQITNDIQGYGGLRRYMHATPCTMCPHNPYCDITGPRTGVADGNIDIRDVATVATRFGQTDP